MKEFPLMNIENIYEYDVFKNYIIKFKECSNKAWIQPPLGLSPGK